MFLIAERLELTLHSRRVRTRRSFRILDAHTLLLGAGVHFVAALVELADVGLAFGFVVPVLVEAVLDGAGLRLVG